jgi:capsular exopolysaccharide synthesis family protein
MITALTLFLMTPRYSGKSVVLIDSEPPQELDVQQSLNVSNASDSHDYYKTQYALLASENLAAEVVRDLHLEENPIFTARGAWATFVGRVMGLLDFGAASSRPQSARDAASSLRFGVDPLLIDLYLSRLMVVAEPGTRLVDVSFSSTDPALAAQIVNEHVRDYVELVLQLRQQAGSSARKFLGNQLDGIRERVEKAEAALNTYRNQMGIVSFGVDDAEKNRISEERMLELTKELTAAEDERIAAEAQMQLVREGNYDSLPGVVSNNMIASLKPEVGRLEAEYAALASEFGPEYPKMKAAKAQLKEARARLASAMGSVALAVQRNYKAAMGRERELGAEVAEEKQKILALNDLSLKDAVLAREVETNRELYKSVLKRMQEIGVSGSAPVANVTIVEDAVTPRFPSFPKKFKSLAVTGLGSFLFAVGLVFFVHQMDNRLKNAEEVESYLNLPTIAVVPNFDRRPARRLIPGSSPVQIAVMMSNLDSNKSLPPSNGDARSRNYFHLETEIYKSIRTALMFSQAGKPPQTILVTSALSGEGKTRTVAQTALAFAQTGAKTLLIDADFRGPQCHHIFRSTHAIGLSQVLAGQAEPPAAVHEMVHHHGLFLLGAGPAVPNPGELLTSMKMSETLKALGEEYRYILIDSSPLVFASDTLGLATMVDGVVVVAGAETAKQTILRVCLRLRAAGVKIFGVLLNGIDIRHSIYNDFLNYYSKYGQHCRTDSILLTDRD